MIISKHRENLTNVGILLYDDIFILVTQAYMGQDEYIVSYFRNYVLDSISVNSLNGSKYCAWLYAIINVFFLLASFFKLVVSVKSKKKTFYPEVKR